MSDDQDRKTRLSVWERLQALADEYPTEIELEIVGGDSGHMGETLEQRAARAERRRAIAIVRKSAAAATGADLLDVDNDRTPRRGRTIVGGEFERRPDETDGEWAAALARHEIERLVGKLFMLKHAIDHAVAALCDVEEPSAVHLRDAADLAAAVMAAAATSSRRDEVTPAIDELLDRVLDVRTEIARASGAGEAIYDPAAVEVLKGMKPPVRRPDGHFTREEEAEILRDPGPEVPLAEIVSDPQIMSGDPTIAGTRILAETILAYIRDGYTEEQIREDFPTLPPDGIGAVLRWDMQRQLDENSPLIFGSGDFLRDQGYPNPNEIRVKFALSGAIALAAEDMTLDAAGIAERAGIEPEIAAKIVDGRVKEISVYELMCVLSTLDRQVAIEIIKVGAGEGDVYVVE